MKIFIAVKRFGRVWREARRNARAVAEWWRNYVDEADRAENPMRLW